MNKTSEIKIEENDRVLLKGMKNSMNNTICKLKSSWKLSVFAKCFPSLAAHHESTLEAIRNMILEPVVEALYSDLSSITEEELAEPLNRLSSLVKANSNSPDDDAWRPSGSPTQDTRAHDVKNLQYEKQKLLQTLELNKEKRIQLFEKVKAGRTECHNNHLLIDQEVEKQRNVLSIVEDIPINRIANYVMQE